MSHLLDTNVISELVRPKPNKNVLAWFKNIPNDVLHLSVLSIGEIRKGVESLNQHDRKEKLRIWLENDLPDWFGDRLITINQAVTDRWGRLQFEMKHSIPAIDSLIAATALHYDFRLVTRNVKDFTYPGLITINPWEE